MLSTRMGLIAIAAIAAACAAPSHPEGPGGVITGVLVETGHEFEISAGQEAQVRGTSLTIRFVGVTEDSRCPSDVQCVWAGNAIARLALGATATPGMDAGLNTMLDPKSASYAGYRISLTGLRPVPRSGTTIPGASYVATLEVRPL